MNEKNRGIIKLKHFITSTSVLAIIALSACASSNNGGGDNAAAFIAKVEAIGADFDNVVEVSVDDLPDSAELSGYLAIAMSFEGESDGALIGEASATANFITGEFTDGTVTNFAAYDTEGDCTTAGSSDCSATLLGDTVEGALTLTGSITDTSFDFAVDGELTGTFEEEGESTDFVAVVDIDGTGTFGTIDDNLVALGTGDGDVATFEGGSVKPFVVEAEAFLYLED